MYLMSCEYEVQNISFLYFVVKTVIYLQTVRKASEPVIIISYYQKDKR